MALENGYCEHCGKIYTDINKRWCKPCQLENLRQNFTIYISGNEKIDDFIQEMQLKISIFSIIFEWIPYNQFNDIKQIRKDDSTTLYSAIWMDGPLEYKFDEPGRYPNREVALKCFNNSQNITNEFYYDEVRNF
jgi:hypothetical protein